MAERARSRSGADASISPCYVSHMTKAEIDAVLDRVKTWPPERQEEALAILLEIEAEVTGVYQLTEEDREAIELSREQARRGEFATDEEVAAVFDRYRRK